MAINLIKFENPDCDKKILVIGVFHGDEPQGEYFINSYLKKIKSTTPFKNSLYFIARLNNTNTRKNINGVDLNRNFPTKNWTKNDPESDYYSGTAPNSEIEVRFIVDLFKKNNFDAVITIHSPYKTVNYDGPAQDLAQKISEILGYPATADIGYPTPGSFGTYSGVERQIPTITIEIDEEEDIEKLNKKFEKLFDWLKDEY